VDFSHRLLKHAAKRIYYSERAIIYHRARADLQTLRRQAGGYGAGAAELYRLYPDEVRWDAGKTLTLIGLLCGETAMALAAAAGARMGLVDKRKAEFFTYRAFWTRSYWAGFGRRVWDARRGLAW
jgi:hypothetical protein